MPENPYEPPREVEEPIAGWRQPHWPGVALWGTIAAICACWVLMSWSEYSREGFVGGDGLSAFAKWSINFVAWGLYFPCALYRLWLAVRWFPADR